MDFAEKISVFFENDLRGRSQPDVSTTVPPTPTALTADVGDHDCASWLMACFWFYTRPAVQRAFGASDFQCEQSIMQKDFIQQFRNNLPRMYGNVHKPTPSIRSVE